MQKSPPPERENRDMNYYAVIDTNVLVSALLRWDSVPGVIVERALTGNIIPLLHSDILKEYENVLHRPKFSFAKTDIQLLLDGISRRGIFFDPADFTDDFIDPKDAIFYAVTMDARKWEDAYLVTGNIRHFPLRPYIVTPREMLTILETFN